MTEPAASNPDPLEEAVDQAIALCEGDVRAALRAALVYNDFLERKLETMRGMVSLGYTRGKISPESAASQKLDDWRDTSRGEADESG
jgi:hypothetical protein